MFDGSDGAFFAMQSDCFGTGSDLSAVLPDDSGQGIGKLETASGKTALAVDVQHVDQSVNIGWGMVRHASVHWVHIGQNILETGIVDITCDELVGRHEEFLGMGENGKILLSEIKEPHLLGNPVRGIDITGQVVLLLRETPGEIGCEIMAAARYGITFVFVQIEQRIHALVV